MQQSFDNILMTEGVKGAILLSTAGDILFEHLSSPAQILPADIDWAPFIGAFADINEADVIFENLRFYVRKAELGYLLIVVEPLVSMAMVRLNTDLLLAALKERAAPRGLKRFFKSKK